MSAPGLRAVWRWWFAAVPLARIAWLRAAIYAFVIVDVLVFANDVPGHAQAPAELYRPLALARALHLPAPTQAAAFALQWGLIAACALAATGRAPRLLGWPIAAGFGIWLLWEMSYGKVDHDHLALVVAVAVLPTVGAAGRCARGGDERAAWALRCIQLAVAATYVLSVWAKLRHGGWDWPTGATLLWAIERRGTVFSDPLADFPDLLVFAQWGVLIAEAAVVVVFWLRGRALGVVVGAYLAFHLMTYAALSIHFAPLVICWLAFAPLERIPSWRENRRRRSVLGRAHSAGGPAPG
ncbi:MAG: MFS transporter permease [Sporichthyaceae bacterium]